MTVNAINATKTDLIAGLGGPFEVDERSFEVPGEFSDPPIENERFSAVPWSVSATHVDWFVGLAPTRRTVRIEGVTIVKLPPEGTEDEPEFLRYIDWSAVLAQLGVAMTGRPMLATD